MVQIQELFSTNIANAKPRKIGQITYNPCLYRAIEKEQRGLTLTAP